MRKNIILLIFILFTTLLCSAQKDSTSQKRTFGVRAGIANSFSNDAIIYYANISVEKGKNFAAFGPIFGKPLKMNFDYPYTVSDKLISLNGLYFIYQRNPNPKAKRFDFYFQYVFNWFYYTDKGIDDYIILNSKFYQTNLSYSSQKSALGSTIGYGFKYKMLDNLFLFQDFGMGAGYTSLFINHEEPKFDRIQKYFEPIVGLNIGLEYRFDKKIRK